MALNSFWIVLLFFNKTVSVISIVIASGGQFVFFKTLERIDCARPSKRTDEKLTDIRPENPFALMRTAAKQLSSSIDIVSASIFEELSAKGMNSAVFLLTGIPPLVNATLAQIVLFQAPAAASGILVMRYFAPAQFFPISSTVQAVMQAFRIAPLVLLTFLRPSGHSFKVTPKGSDAGRSAEDRFVIRLSLSIIFLTGLGLYLNANFETRIVGEGYMLPVVTFWAIINMTILLLVITTAIPRPISRAEERFHLSGACKVYYEGGQVSSDLVDMSLSGARISIAEDGHSDGMGQSDWVGLKLPNLSVIPARISRSVMNNAEGAQLGISFKISSGPNRDALIQNLFTQDSKPSFEVQKSRNIAIAMLSRILARTKRATPVGLGEDLSDSIVTGWRS
jgi:cellulose synthase (UDP-forming)